MTSSAAARLRSLAKSPVYDTYWRFAAERQRVYLKRLLGAPRPWTADAVIRDHRFTNAYRASDRVSQYLIRNVIHREDLPQAPEEVFYRTLLFKLFNKIETWERVEAACGGAVSWREHDGKRLDAVFEGILAGGETLYSAAYIMPSGTSSFGHGRKHRNHIALVEKMMREDLPRRIQDAADMAEAVALLRAQPTIGDFLAYQLATDLNYGPLVDFDEMSFVLPGPGAEDGLQKCFGPSEIAGAELIRLVAEAQEEEFAARGIAFDGLFGRPLQLIDCQNLFCEIDKYARVMHPDVAGRSGRTRIKQVYREAADPMPTPFFPPKWGLNDGIPAALLRLRAEAGVPEGPRTSGNSRKKIPVQGSFPF